MFAAHNVAWFFKAQTHETSLTYAHHHHESHARDHHQIWASRASSSLILVNSSLVKHSQNSCIKSGHNFTFFMTSKVSFLSQRVRGFLLDCKSNFFKSVESFQFEVHMKFTWYNIDSKHFNLLLLLSYYLYIKFNHFSYLTLRLFFYVHDAFSPSEIDVFIILNCLFYDIKKRTTS